MTLRYHCDMPLPTEQVQFILTLMQSYCFLIQQRRMQYILDERPPKIILQCLLINIAKLFLESLEDICFTMLCQFLPYNVVNQLYVYIYPGFPGGKESTCNAGDVGSIPGFGRSPQGMHSNPLQSSCLEKPIQRADSWATVHWVSKRQTRCSD